nr:MAG TPA: hypothetical protein [Caudoviricetes sp.]
MRICVILKPTKIFNYLKIRHLQFFNFAYPLIGFGV